MEIIDHDDASSLLTRYLSSLSAQQMFAPGGPRSYGQNGGDRDLFVSRLIRLIELQTDQSVREAATGLLTGLPTPRLVEWFASAFSGDSTALAGESTSIYVRGLPADRRAEGANHLISEFSRRIEGLFSGEVKGRSVTNELEFALSSIQQLQSFTEFRDERAFAQARRIIDRRDEFRSGAVPDAACRAYAAMYRVRPNRDSSPDPAQLAPLVEVLNSEQESTDLRFAAATSLGDTAERTVIKPLAAVAQTPREPLRVRMAAVGGLAKIGRVHAKQEEVADEVAAVLSELLDTERYQSDAFFEDVSHAYADLAKLEDLPRILSLLSLPVHNFAAQRCIYTFMLRFPESREKIATDTLVAVSRLTAEPKRTLFPGPDSILSEMHQVYRQSQTPEVEIALRALAPALARISINHPDGSVRLLASQNLHRLVGLVTGLPPIDPQAPDGTRRQQLVEWEKAWAQALPTVVLNEGTQLVGHAGEIP
jgi:hypothetical protein